MLCWGFDSCSIKGGGWGVEYQHVQNASREATLVATKGSRTYRSRTQRSKAHKNDKPQILSVCPARHEGTPPSPCCFEWLSVNACYTTFGNSFAISGSNLPPPVCPSSLLRRSFPCRSPSARLVNPHLHRRIYPGARKEERNCEGGVLMICVVATIAVEHVEHKVSRVTFTAPRSRSNVSRTTYDQYLLAASPKQINNWHVKI